MPNGIRLATSATAHESGSCAGCLVRGERGADGRLWLTDPDLVERHGLRMVVQALRLFRRPLRSILTIAADQPTTPTPSRHVLQCRLPFGGLQNPLDLNQMTKQQLIEKVAAKTELGKAQPSDRGDNHYRGETGCELQARQGADGEAGSHRDGSEDRRGRMTPSGRSGRAAIAEQRIGMMIDVGGAAWPR